ncbi:MAG: hypothetical protein COZ28_00345 [Candidatus Moranbacteria bacterium CG_4_10_14_3_um_filter_44_15]|nr:MAG: hypothetical protein COS72_02640 [Candidatus Moranbacteria bacterium CG06_land_8_20_14_3_00_43_56]PIW93351.1 MAG: hypothetical protein COZ87_01830 [Candidatus Moranbacteria bacterium CG_4_8_14_3_um_filter_43_15]PIX91132.1 MAG: hypothetical protein COZ28_00345 [Candidatus Moranbacteria bacterium CG_4_10_14_3_um_filter_44_15]PJA86213.1 MAG: hypothetical protein CO142_01485 [Candidatus Moranbacteria bacterium CG_4_9_14_3_um_filter_44_28]
MLCESRIRQIISVCYNKKTKPRQKSRWSQKETKIIFYSVFQATSARKKRGITLPRTKMLGQICKYKITCNQNPPIFNCCLLGFWCGV